MIAQRVQPIVVDDEVARAAAEALGLEPFWRVLRDRMVAIGAWQLDGEPSP